MVKSKTKYICGIRGREFESKSAAEEHEAMMLDIQQSFSFFKLHDDDTCSFANGYYTIQRDKATYDKLIQTIIRMVKKYHPYTWKQYEKHGGLTKEHVEGYSFLGRYLDDGDSPLYFWWGIQGNICKSCYREHGQIYYKNNCDHEKETREP